MHELGKSYLCLRNEEREQNPNKIASDEKEQRIGFHQMLMRFLVTRDQTNQTLKFPTLHRTVGEEKRKKKKKRKRARGFTKITEM